MDKNNVPSTSKRTRYERKRPLTYTELQAILEASDDDDNVINCGSDSEWEGNDISESENEDEIEELPQIENFIEGLPERQNENEHPEQLIDNIWSPEATQRPQIPFAAIPGLKINPDGNDPIDYFNLIANNQFYELIVSNTNLYAVEILAQSNSEMCRIAFWKDVTEAEFKIVLGLLFHMGTIKLNRINDYWKTSKLFSIPVFATYMSRNRFVLILRALHFNDNAENPQSKLCKIMPLVEFFNNRMDTIYYPKREISVDESLVLWRGRLKFRQYIKGKRHKFGLKLYILTEHSGLIQKFFVYAGSEDNTVAGTNHTKKVVLKLMEGHMNVGHALYMDNFYNSVSLTRELLAAHTYVTGTLRKDRRGNPETVMSKKLKKHEVTSMYTPEGICVSKWKDKRDIYMISSEFSDQMVTTTSRKGIQSEKPKLVVQYNKHKCGIDLSDQMLSYYCCEHKCLRWYKKLGVHIFQMILMNAYFLYNNSNQKKMSLYEFRLLVIESLLGPSPKDSPIKKPLVEHLPQNCPKGPNGKTKRRRCKYCWDTSKTRKDSIYYCPQCVEEPGLCLENCFRLFHEQMNN